VRRGASWTAAYHLQLTVAAVDGPVASSLMPSSVLLSGPGWTPPRRRLPGGAASGHPAGRRCRRGRHCQDAAVASLTGVRCPPIRLRRLGSAAQPSGVRPVRCPPVRCPPVRCPPVRCPPVRCPAVRCPVTWVRRPGPADPAGCCPAVQPSLSNRPVSSRLLSIPSSVRSRPSPPTSSGGARTRPRRPAPVTTATGRGPVAAAPSGG
jgi:hypothetical protein